jgi:signal transduction histidine kinase
MWHHSGRDSVPLSVILAVLVVVAAGLTVLVVVLTVTYWQRRVHGSSWTQAESSYFVAGWVSVLAGQLAGLWLWWRAPRNPTGRWLWLAGLSLGLWFVGTYWPNGWGMQLTWAVYLFRPALALAFLGWPTGWPSPGVRRWIVGLTAAAAGCGLVIGLFGRAQIGQGWPTNPLAPFDVGWVDPVFGSITHIVLYTLPAAAVLVILVRRWRVVSTGARPLVTPVTLAGVAVAASDLFVFVTTSFFAGQTWDQATNHATVLGAVNLTQNYAQVAIAAAGLIVAFGLRRRAAAGAGARSMTLGLGRSTPEMAPSAAAARLLGDPSARVVYRRSADVWVDGEGRPAPLDAPGRTVTPVIDADGVVLAGIETDSRRGIHPSLIEIAAAMVLARARNDHARAVAKTRQRELRALQIALVDAVDAARVRLERDLHDGAQQRLVGLALAARLAARHPTADAKASLKQELANAREEITELLAGTTPVVLEAGLASALHTLAATTPLQGQVRCIGDLASNDPLARTMWLIASEATTNAEKHANASSLRIDLIVDAAMVTLRVVDDGLGGVLAPPRTIFERAAEAGGTVFVLSPPGAGTELSVACPRARVEAA